MKFLKDWSAKLLPYLFAIFVIALPFNIVWHFDSLHAYVDGYFVNYLDFVVHVVDLVAVAIIALGAWYEALWKKREFWIFVSILLAFALVQIFAVDSEISVYFISRFCLYVLTGYVAAILVVGKNLKNIVVISLACIAVFEAMLAIYQFTSGNALGLKFLGESVVQVGMYNSSSVHLASGTFLRGYGTFPHPNLLGAFLSVAFFVIFHEILNLHTRTMKISLILVEIVIAAGLLVTWSRSALLMLSVVCSIYLFSRLFRKSKKLGLSVFVIFFITITSFAFWVYRGNSAIAQDLRTRLIDQTSLSDVSIIERKELAIRALDDFKQHPIVGVGLGNFISSTSENPVYNESQVRVMQPAHNYLLLALAETGVVGILLICGIFYIIFRRTKWTLFSVLFLVIIFGLSIFDHYFWSLAQGSAILLILTPIILSTITFSDKIPIIEY